MYDLFRYNRNPTARIFRCGFSQICSYSLMQRSSNCNCEPDTNEFLTLDVLKNVPIETTFVEQEEETSINIDSDTNHLHQLITMIQY